MLTGGEWHFFWFVTGFATATAWLFLSYLACRLVDKWIHRGEDE